jgi:hypothetical protein
MNTELFLNNLNNKIFVNDELTRTHGYVDFLVCTKEVESTYDLRSILPQDFQRDYISNTPGIPLSNGKYVYYCRADIGVVKNLLCTPNCKHLFLADSWNTLFYMDFPFWNEVFDIETRRVDDFGNSNYWRGKPKDIGNKDTIVKAYVPHVFAGDTVPDLDLTNWQLQNIFQGSTENIPKEINIIVATVNNELINYLKAHPKDLYKLKPRQFEELICEILKNFGWEVELTKATRDGGYDIFAISKDITGAKSSWLIECKKYAEKNKVGIDVVRSLCGVKNDLKVANALIATTSFFSSEVIKTKNSRYDLELVDYNGIINWLNNQYKQDLKTGIYVPS